MVSFNNQPRTREDLINLYYEEYPDVHYKSLPEFIIEKLDLPPDMLLNLRVDINNRSREEIREWMQNSGISLEDFNWVGW